MPLCVMRRHAFLGILWFTAVLSVAKPLGALERKQQPAVQVTASTTPVSIPAPASTFEYELPYPGILPDHPLYFFKVIRDHIVMLFSKDLEKRIDLSVLMADKRLAMGRELVHKNQGLLGASTISKGEKYLLEAVATMKTMSTQGHVPSVGLVNKVVRAVSKHKEIILELNTQTTGEVQSSLGLSWQLVQDVERQLELFKKEEKVGM